MRNSAAVILSVLLLAAISFGQQNQQSAPPPGDQSSYPSETHKMTTAEKRDTPSANGQPVDLNSASKKDLAALPGIGSPLCSEHHRCSSLWFQRRSAQEEADSSGNLRQDSEPRNGQWPQETISA